MSDVTHPASIARRVVAEYRGVVVPLLVALTVNVLFYAFGVYPLANRLANMEQRDRAAEEALQAARREYAAAQGALTGKARAATELDTFYTKILPPDLAGARRLTFLRLAQMAEQADLRYQSHRYETLREKESTLTRMRIEVSLEGNYNNIREFLYQLDTAPEFVVVDDVSLSEAQAERGGLEFKVQLSTYFRSPPTS